MADLAQFRLPQFIKDGRRGWINGGNQDFIKQLCALEEELLRG